ncbi:MAG: protein kinase [Deinococcales bacterium]
MDVLERVKTFYHYDLLEPLGQGGMGVVYKAYDTKAERLVALKLLPPLSDEVKAQEAYHRFIQEAKIIEGLEHPHICKVYEAQVANAQQAFIAMAYYEGESLAERLSQGALNPEEALSILKELSEALAYAHAHQIIHRDIKPANIFLSQDQGVILLDFGIAKMGASHQESQEGPLMGTIDYLSPERLRGQEGGARDDIWSLGVVFYEMLTETTPFHQGANLSATILSILNDAVEPLEAWLPFPPDNLDSLQALIDRCLAKDAKASYPDMLLLLADIESLLKGEALSYLAQANLKRLPDTPILQSDTAHNLPHISEPLIGRQDELRLIAHYLHDPEARLISLLGTGGIGKTRLSLEAARGALSQERFKDGVYFVSLEALASPFAIPSALAEALAIELQGRQEAVGEIASFIGQKAMLIVLDNYEHLMDGRDICEALLSACPELCILVTSRERLNLSLEWIIPLEGLALPDTAVSLEEVRRYGGLELFLASAHRLSQPYEPNSADIPAIVQICRLLYGSPLELQLAASWLDYLDPAQILAEIEQSLDFLESTDQSLAPRHRSMRAVFNYSWQLLSPDEQDLLCQLAVFQGSFSSEAAEAISGASLDSLLNLLNKSMLQVLSSGHFDHHPLLKQYILEQAQATDHFDKLLSQHAAYYLAQVRGQQYRIRGAEQQEILKHIENNLANIRLAWQWALKQGDDVAIAESVETLRRFYQQKGRLREGIEHFKEVSNILESRSHEARHLLWLNQAWLYFMLGDYALAKQLGLKALIAAQQLKDEWGFMGILNLLGAIDASNHNYQEAALF